MIKSYSKPQLVQQLRARALAGINDGTPLSAHYFQRCIGHHTQSGATVILTRDEGHHACGWFKNPEYDRCWHLSLSFSDPETGESAPKDEALTLEFLDLVFRKHVTKLWCEPPYSEQGKARDVWHYRLFCRENWEPFIPRGEVYSKKFTEKGWMSYSEAREHSEEERRSALELIMNENS